jgi:gluconokinase
MTTDFGGSPMLVIIGVSGSGKTTIGKLLAKELGWDFEEGDDLHPADNIAKMRAGVPLDDADRAPWLAAIGRWIDAQRGAHRPGIITCSALKRIYRATLCDGRPELRFVYLKVSRETVGRRLAARQGHFMPPSLADSQFATLEEPSEQKHAIVIDGEASAPDIVASIIDRLRITVSATKPETCA